MRNDDYDHNYFVWLGRTLYAEMKAAQYAILVFGGILVILGGPISIGIIYQGLRAKCYAESEAEQGFYKFRIIAYSFALYAWCLLGLELFTSWAYADWFNFYWPSLCTLLTGETGLGENHIVGLMCDLAICFGLYFYFDSKSESCGELSYNERDGYVFSPKW